MIEVLIEPPYVKKETDSNAKVVQEQARVDSLNHAYQLDWANKVQEARQRKRRLESNMKLAYTYIFSQFCDKELRSKI